MMTSVDPSDDSKIQLNYDYDEGIYEAMARRLERNVDKSRYV